MGGQKKRSKNEDISMFLNQPVTKLKREADLLK